MFYVAMGLVEDRQIAEDAVQESFINLWAHREQINPDYEPSILPESICPELYL